MQIQSKFNNGEFKVVGKIGDGTFGEIYEAINKEDKRVALKVVPFLTERRKRVFMRESIITQKLLRSPAGTNIIEVESYYYNDQVGVMVMEKMDCDLLDYIVRSHSISEEESKVIFREICKAIFECHSAGISHLDLKPDNVLLKFRDGEGRGEGLEAVKLADFGYSVDFSRRRLADQTILSFDPSSSSSSSSSSFSWRDRMGYNFEFNQTVGTKEYRSPETFTGSAYQADKVDIWGLGVILFAMIAGSFPYAEVNGRMEINDFAVISKRTCDHYCLNLLSHLLAIDPNERYNILQVLSHPWLSS